MKDEMLNRAFVVQEPSGAAVLVDSRLRGILLMFASRPRAISEVALEAGMDIKRLHHHVQRIVASGLLRIVGERKRRGRPLKLYHAVADAFFVRDEWMPKPFTEDFSDELRQGLANQFQPGRGMLFGLGVDGRPQARRIEDQDSPSHVLNLWFVVQLDPRALPALKEEIRTLVRRFEEESGETAPLYLMHAAAAPKRPD